MNWEKKKFFNEPPVSYSRDKKAKFTGHPLRLLDYFASTTTTKPFSVVSAIFSLEKENDSVTLLLVINAGAVDLRAQEGATPLPPGVPTRLTRRPRLIN